MTKPLHLALSLCCFAAFASAKTAETTGVNSHSKLDGGHDLRCNGFKIGDSCNKDDCEECGYCWELHSFYYICERVVPDDPKVSINVTMVHKACDKNLWWNPDHKPNGVKIGGACDFWDNLSKKVQERYLSDPNCVIPVEFCEYGQDEADLCSGNYFYFDPKRMADRENLACSNGLFWDPSTETCRACQNVVNLDKSKCNCV